jgi:hypothetical protein
MTTEPPNVESDSDAPGRPESVEMVTLDPPRRPQSRGSSVSGRDSREGRESEATPSSPASANAVGLPSLPQRQEERRVAVEPVRGRPKTRGPRERPRRRDGADDAAPPDLEPGIPAPLKRLAAWLERAKPVNPQWLSQLSTDDVAVIAATATGEATEHAEASRHSYAHSSGSQRVMNYFRDSTAFQDAKESSRLREALRGLRVYAGGPVALDLMRDIAETLEKEVQSLGSDHGLLHDDPRLVLIKQQVTSSLRAVKEVIGATAYDKDLGERGWPLATLAAGTLVGGLPYAYALFSQPTSWFYLTSLLGAEARTLPLLAGQLFNPALNTAMAFDHVREQRVLWALPALFYSAAAFIQAVAAAHPGNAQDNHNAAEAKHIASFPAFLVAAALVEGVVFAALNHPQVVSSLLHQLRNSLPGAGDKPVTQSLFRQGKLRMDTPSNPQATAEQQEKFARSKRILQNGYKLLETLQAASVQSFIDTSSNQLSATQKTKLQEIKGKQKTGRQLSTEESTFLEQARTRFEQPGAAQQATLAALRHATGELNETLDLSFGGFKETVSLLTPEQQMEKNRIAWMVYTLVGILAAIAVGSVAKTPALLTDYIPYYLTSVSLLYSRKKDPKYTRADLLRTAGVCFGGTALAAPPGLFNAISLADVREGFWDVVTRNSVAEKHPLFLPVAQHTKLHGDHGLVNFSLVTTYNVGATLWAGGRISTWLAERLQKAYEHFNRPGTAITQGETNLIRADPARARAVYEGCLPEQGRALPASVPRPHERLSPDALHRTRQLEAGFNINNTSAAVDLVLSLNATREPTAGAPPGVLNEAVQGVITPAPQPTNDPRALAAVQRTVEAVNLNMDRARAQLSEGGAAVAPNQGQGLNCLILSLLQHATRTYTLPEESMVRTAERLRTELHLGHGMLLPDDPKFVMLVNRINEDYPDAHLNVTVAVPHADGGFIPMRYDNRNANRVLVLQGGHHYEAVTWAAAPRRTRTRSPVAEQPGDSPRQSPIPSIRSGRSR